MAFATIDRVRILLCVTSALAMWTASGRGQGSTTQGCEPPTTGNAAQFLFEIDGNLECGDTAGGVLVGGDWYDLIERPGASCSGGVLIQGPPTIVLCRARPKDPSNTIFIQDPATRGPVPDTTTFGGMSNRNEDDISLAGRPWIVATNRAPQSHDLTEVYLHARLDPATADFWLIGGFAYRSGTPNKHVDFELLQAGAALQGARLVGLGARRGRTVGDIVFSIDLVRGGKEACISARIWDGERYRMVSPLPSDEAIVFSGVNQEPLASPCNVFLDSPTGEIGRTYAPLQFTEFAINVTRFAFSVGPGSNLAFLVKSRVSNSFLSELMDFALVQIPTGSPDADGGPREADRPGPATTGGDDETGAARIGSGGGILLSTPIQEPHTGRVRIPFTVRLEAGAPVRIDVYDIAGRRLRRLVDRRFAPGRHETTWDGTTSDGTRVRPGVYLIRARAEQLKVHAVKVIHLR